MILAAGNRAWGWASSATITPSSATVTVSHQLQFSVSGQNSNKTWSVNGIAGGNATLGTITVSGLYTAPAAPPSPATVNITIGNASGSGAKVTIVPATGVTVSISPASATVLVSNTVPFSAAVSGSANTTVSWSVNGIAGGNSTVGTISTTGLYTAPAAIPSSGAVSVTATSNADATQSAQATVTITSVSVLVSPSNVTLSTLQTQVFTASVSGSSNTGVNWSVNGIAGGNSTVGTISTGGFYTAPAAVPAGSIVVAATSQADPTKSSQASVTIIAGTLNITPLSTTVGTAQTVQFTVLQSSNQTSGQASQPKYTWSVNGVAGGNSAVGTITNKGIYTAPAVPPSPPTITITASTSTQNGTANALVVPIAVSVSPSTASVPVQKGQQFAAAVTGTTQTAVTWSVNGVAGGNSTVGTISSNGMYTAPATAPSPATVAVAAQSVADPTKQSNASVNITGSSLTVTTSSLPNGWTGVAYTASLTASGGTAPYTWSISGGLLPAGVSLGTTTGLLSGTPATSAAGAYNGQVTVTDALGGTATITLSFTIALSLSITTASVPGGTAGASYTYALASTGGTSPVSWTVASGQLPAGMTLSSSGTLSGTPAAAGSYTFVAQVADSSSPQETASQSYTLPVANPGSTSATITVLNADLPGGTIGVPYTATMSASGGTPPYTWSVASGSLPAGLTLDASTGVISGSPTAVGWSDMFTVQAQDSVGGTGSLFYSVIVSPVLDQFGGATSLSCKSTGFFHTQKINDRWWFCTPNGSVLFANGATLIPGGDSIGPSGTSYNAVATKKYGDVAKNWGLQQDRRIQSWGFNAIGELSSAWTWPTTSSQAMPFLPEPALSGWAARNQDGWAPGPTKDLFYGVNDRYTGWRGGLLDFYDTNFAIYYKNHLANNPLWNSLFTNPWVLGWLVDDSDWLFGFGAGVDFKTKGDQHNNSHIGYITLIEAPEQTFNPSSLGSTAQLYADRKVYSKTAAANPPSGCSLQTPCSLRDYLYAKYNGNISALNMAWGSNYTTFDSTSNRATEPVATADGITRQFAYTLQHFPASPLSVYVKVDETAIAGDCPWWNSSCGTAVPHTGTLSGPTNPFQTYPVPAVGAIYSTPKAGYPQIMVWMQIAYHFGSAGGPASRLIYENFSAGNLQPVAPSPDPNAQATGFDVYMACRMAESTTPAFGCVSADAPIPTPTLQVSNVPIGTNWGVPSSGLVQGALPPASVTAVNYTNGQLTFQFASPPPQGAVITVEYSYNGWGSGGTGLMDEDGSNTTWVGTNSICLTQAPVCDGNYLPLPNANPNLGSDLDAWITQFAGQYFSSVRGVMKSLAPNQLYLGTDIIGSWYVPPRKQILLAAAAYCDALYTQLPDDQSMLDFIGQWAGDIPLMNFQDLSANADSSVWQYGDYGGLSYPTQEDRGRAYETMTSFLLNNTPASTNSHPWIASIWWALPDFCCGGEHANWGLVSINDNPYDGKSSCQTTRVDPWGYPAGGEQVIPSWQAQTLYSPLPSSNSRIQVDISGTTFEFTALSGGTSGQTPPAWPTAPNQTVSDGGIIWQNVGPKSSANCYGDAIDFIKGANALWYSVAK